MDSSFFLGTPVLSRVLKSDIIVVLSRKIIEIVDLNGILIRMCAFRN
jgi:hypothetical protein